MDDIDKIIIHICYCVLPKLSKNMDEIDNHPEYYERQNVDFHFPLLIKNIEELEFGNTERLTTNVMATLIILYKQRANPAVYNTPKCKSYAKKLNLAFRDKVGVTLDRVLQDSDFCNTQEIFDNIILELNTKLVSEDFKKYPGLIDVYCSLIKDLKGIKIKINPMKIFPVSLLLLDDYNNFNKIKGLKCYRTIIQCLNEKHFKSGNYYEVLLSSLKKAMAVKDVEVTTLVLQSFLDLIKIIPSDLKDKKTDEVFGLMLEQLHLESNLHRKTVCVRFLKEAIAIHKVNCVSKKLLKVVLLENIHICCNDAVADILLVDVLECLQVWISHCWCVWQLSTDHKILSALIKLLYVSRKEFIASVIQDIIVTLVHICTKDEQKAILQNLEKSDVKSPEFKEKLEEIKTEISLLCK